MVRWYCLIIYEDGYFDIGDMPGIEIDASLVGVWHESDLTDTEVSAQIVQAVLNFQENRTRKEAKKEEIE